MNGSLVRDGTAAGYTHTGRRKSNQDAVILRSLPGGAELIAIADGMGGHLAGEIASALALEALVGALEGGAPLREAVSAANARVYAEAEAHPERKGMGTTLVALLRTGATYEIANVGDSRAYRVDEQGITRLTDDHSFVAEAIREGTMSPEEAARSPWRNALTRAIGTDAEVEVDLLGPLEVGPPHVVLLCTDGLYRSVDDDVIQEYMLSEDDLGAVVETLAALAFRRGSDDNISVGAVEFGTVPRRAPRHTLPLPIPVQVQARGGRRPRPPSGARPPANVAGASPEPSMSASPTAEPSTTATSRPAIHRSQTHADATDQRRLRRRRERRKRAIRVFSVLVLFLMLLLFGGIWLSA
jgi:PPM family protein phosphatase